MMRGDVWMLVGVGTRCAQRARPAVVVQDDRFADTASIAICVFTDDATEAPLFRLVIEPTEHNGLRRARRLMVDKITTVPKSFLRVPLGRLHESDIVRLNQAMLLFLGLTLPARIRRHG